MTGRHILAKHDQFPLDLCADMKQLTNCQTYIFLQMMVVNARPPQLLELRHRFLCHFTTSFHTSFRVAFHSITPWRDLFKIVCDLWCFFACVFHIWRWIFEKYFVSWSCLRRLWAALRMQPPILEDINIFWSITGFGDLQVRVVRKLARIGAELSSSPTIFDVINAYW